MSVKKRTDAKKRSGNSRAETADRHVLYQKSVQDTAEEYEFVSSTFQKLRKRPARSLREDFCGTAAMCCEWVGRDDSNTAVGVDIDPDVLAWGRRNNISGLTSEQQMRLQLVREDVCKVTTPEPVDVVLAMNFSYQIFKSRELLGGYFRSVHQSLKDDGILFIDVFGGYEVYEETKEKRSFKGFKYIWDHASYNPINGDLLCHIHFKFPDGSKMEKAFTYDWRLWTLPELQELMHDAGFKNVEVYWEESDEDDEGTGVYSPATVSDSDPGWICFLVAEK